jgi:hypothetical protein
MNGGIVSHGRRRSGWDRDPPPHVWLFGSSLSDALDSKSIGALHIKIHGQIFFKLKNFTVNFNDFVANNERRALGPPGSARRLRLGYFAIH